MVAAVNPCGFALLPAYLGLYLGTGDTRVGGRAIPRALAVSAMVTLSFVLLFGAVGLLLSAATSTLAASFPWAGVAVRVLLVFVGRPLAGRGFPLRPPRQPARRPGWEGLPAAEGPGATPPSGWPMG